MVDFLRTSFDKHPFHCPCCGSQLEYCADIKTKSKVGSRLLDTTVRFSVVAEGGFSIKVRNRERIQLDISPVTLTYYNGVGCVRR